VALKRAGGFGWTWTLAAAIAVVTAIWLQAGSAEAAGRRIALVIANANYAGRNVLDNPPHDAALMRSALAKAGFETVVMAPDLTHDAFFARLRDFSREARGAEVALVYYAGHAIQSEGKNWLIPVDATLAEETDLNLQAIDLDTLMSAVEGAKWRVVALDACRDNPFGMQWHGRSRAFQTRGLGGVEADNVLVLFAAAANAQALDGQGQSNSPFAVALARSVAQPGLVIQRLGDQIRDEVLAATDQKQRPYVSSSISNETFYFVPPAGDTGGTRVASAPTSTIAPAAPAPSVPSVDPNALELALWNSVSASNDVDQLNAYLEKYPRGLFAGAARAKIAALARRTVAPQRAYVQEAAPPPPQSRSMEAPQAPLVTGHVNLNDPAAVRVYAHEAYNWNVYPQTQLRPANLISTGTPLMIPGGHVITTGELDEAKALNKPFLAIDVLSGYHRTVARTLSLPGAGFPNEPDRSAQILTALKGARDVPLVFFCAGASCWESYNAALRAIYAGFTNVYWYRGGLEAWFTAHPDGG